MGEDLQERLRKQLVRQRSAANIILAPSLVYEAADEIARLKGENERILVAFYCAAPIAAARLCDMELDRSGALLGRVRSLLTKAAGGDRDL